MSILNDINVCSVAGCNNPHEQHEHLCKEHLVHPSTMQRRGDYTERIASKAVELMGRGITRTELRLMPYIQYVMMNEQKLDPNKVSGEERKVLSLWREKGYIEGGASGLSITKEFWDIINEIVWLGYVDLYDEK